MTKNRVTKKLDAIVIGAGPGGEVVAFRLVRRGLRVALVERELIGGECAYWACVPTKTLLRPVELVGEARRGFGIKGATLDWADLAEYRDYMVRHLDDSAQIEEYGRLGVTVAKAPGRLLEPGRVQAGESVFEAPNVVIATGSEPVIPELEGLARAGFWTNREAALTKKVPRSLLTLGGGPVALEIGQVFARFGSRVTILERADRLLSREDEPLAAELDASLRGDGIEVATGARAARVSQTDSGRRIELEDGRVFEAEELLVATGRRPRIRGLGLEEAYGLSDARSLEIDEYGHARDGNGRAQTGLWGVGDVTGSALFTHVAKYQGRMVAANIAGEERRLDYRAVPRVIFTDPPVAAVGLTEESAKKQGLQATAHQVALKEVTRSWTFEKEPRGFIRLLVDERGPIVGVQIIGPLAGEWIHLGVLAVKLGLTPRDLEDLVVQYPTFSEAYISVAEAAEAARRAASESRNKDVFE